MKIAFIHDWLVVDGGAEKVARAILEVYPDAEVFSLFDFLTKEERDTILMGKKSRTSFLQSFPFARKKYRSLLPLFPAAVEHLNLKGFDLLISSSWAVAKGIKVKAGQLHICYCHSPIRYAWSLQDQYLSDAGLDRGIKGFLANYFLKRIRKWDLRTTPRVHHFIANSQNVANRIQKIYQRDSVVIHPPVETAKFTLQEKKDNFYLTASRLVPYKKIDLIVAAFAKIPDKKLVVFGGGPQLEKLRKEATPNVSILGHQPKEKLIDHMQRAKAFILAAEEDFGITSLEAQACGTPVIAYGKGGYLETVLNGETGLFFAQQNADAVMRAILTFEERGISRDAAFLRQHALGFNRDSFKEQFRTFVDQQLHALD